VTTFQQCLRDEMVRRNYSPTTIRSYLNAQLVLLLLGGNKSTQTADVARAQESWKAYQEGKRRGKTN
jgi:putative component of toxin-antitoxin plasmid stabilization module